MLDATSSPEADGTEPRSWLEACRYSSTSSCCRHLVKDGPRTFDLRSNCSYCIVEVDLEQPEGAEDVEAAGAVLRCTTTAAENPDSGSRYPVALTVGGRWTGLRLRRGHAWTCIGCAHRGLHHHPLGRLVASCRGAGWRRWRCCLEAGIAGMLLRSGGTNSVPTFAGGKQTGKVYIKTLYYFLSTLAFCAKSARHAIKSYYFIICDLFLPFFFVLSSCLPSSFSRQIFQKHTKLSPFLYEIECLTNICCMRKPHKCNIYGLFSSR